MKNKSVYDSTLTFLNETIPDGFYAEDFFEQYSGKLSQYLENIFNAQELLEKKEMIRRGLKEYFGEYHQEIMVVFHKEKHIIIKEKASIDEKIKSRIVLQLTEELKALDESQFPKPINDQTFILGSHELNKIKETVEIDDITFRNSIKLAVRRVLGLHDRDAIFIIQNILYVRKFMMPEVKEENRVERRLDGFDPAIFDSVKEKYFNFDISRELDERLEHLFTHELDFTHIKNDFFLNNYLRFFQYVIEDMVYHKFQEDNTALGYFVNYLLRENFDDMLLFAASRLSYLASIDSGNAKNFLIYYDRFQKDSEYNSKIILDLASEQAKHEANIRLQEKHIAQIKLDIKTNLRKKDLLIEEQRQHTEKFNDFQKTSQAILNTLKNNDTHKDGINKQFLNERELRLVNEKDALDRITEQINIKVQNFKKDRQLLDIELKEELKTESNLESEFEPIMKEYLKAMDWLARSLVEKV